MGKEFKPLLEREKHSSDAQKHFEAQIKLLKDLVDYGSWLIPRAYDSSAKKLEDAMIIGVLLKQVVTMVDAVQVLVSSGVVSPALLQSRSAFEASLYIDWILQKATSKKATYYYVSCLRNDRAWALRGIVGEPAHEKFIKNTKELEGYTDLDTPELRKLAEEQLAEVNKILLHPSLKPVDDEFEQLKKRKGYEPSWYAPLLMTQSSQGLRAIVDEVGRRVEYLMLYESASKVSHIASYKTHIKLKKTGAVIFEPIRWLEGIDLLLLYTISSALSTYKAIIKRYRPGELRSFSKKYITDWRKAYQTIPTVNYIPEE